MAIFADTWHKRLGHACKEKLSRINLSKSNTTNFSSQFCDSCANAKLARTPFPSSFIKTKENFDLIHCDIWDGYRTSSYTKANYFFNIIDDFSRVVLVILIRHKSDASKCIVEIHKMVKVQLGNHIKRIQSDNGGEFTSNHML